MRRTLAALVVLTALVPSAAVAAASAAAADTPVTGLAKYPGRLYVHGATVVDADRFAVSILDGTAFTRINPTKWPNVRGPAGDCCNGDVLDLGTDAAGTPVLVRKICATGVPLCTTPLRANAPIRPIAPIDPAHCTTTGAAIENGRILLAVAALGGRAGQSCHAGIYDGRRLRAPVKRWRIGNPSEIQKLTVTLDVVGANALVQTDQDHFEGGSEGELTRRLQLLSLRTWQLRTVVIADDDQGNGVTLDRPTLGADGIYAVASCGADSEAFHTVAVLRWPLTGGPSTALEDAPYPEPADVVPTPAGLIVEGPEGAAVLRAAPQFAPFSFPAEPACRFGAP